MPAMRRQGRVPADHASTCSYLAACCHLHICRTTTASLWWWWQWWCMQQQASSAHYERHACQQQQQQPCTRAAMPRKQADNSCLRNVLTYACITGHNGHVSCMAAVSLSTPLAPAPTAGAGATWQLAHCPGQPELPWAMQSMQLPITAHAGHRPLHTVLCCVALRVTLPKKWPAAHAASSLLLSAAPIAQIGIKCTLLSAA